MKKQAKILLIGLGIATGVMAFAESARHILADYFVRIALSRQTPPYPTGAGQKIADNCADPNMLALVQQAGERLAEKRHETVTIHSKDGIVLTGHWMPASKPQRLIIAMHGWRSSWEHDFGIISEFLAQTNCSVLYAEQRGQGHSGGEYMGFGLMERYDCLAWIHWINQKTGGSLPIYLCGVSMGASTVLMAGGLSLPPNVHGIIADCGYTAPTDIWRYVAENHLGLSYAICAGPACRLARKKIRINMDAESCPHALSHCKVPVLFIHGTADRFVPVEMTYENFKACNAPKKLFIVAGAQHGMSYLIDQNGYETAVQSFWENYDLKIP